MTPPCPTLLSRRRLLLGAAATPLLRPLAPAHAQRPARSPEVVQIVDTTPGQLDVTRDFLIGSRAAWQEFNARGGWRGHPVQHTVLETDGSTASLRQILEQVRAQSQCVALSGTTGDRAAQQLLSLLQQEPMNLAHVAPWLHQELPAGSEARTFPVFASRHEQIGHALKSLSVVGVHELGVVFASRLEEVLNLAEVSRIATDLKLRLVPYTPTTTLAQLGQSLRTDTPPILLFVGGTPELAQFTRGLQRQDRQRYVIGLADVNLQTLHQWGQSHATAVVAAQVVPMVTASLPIVRQYRDTLARLFDEPPTPQSLAGYIAARYTQDVLQTVEPGASRAQVLQAFQKRQHTELGGFRISYQNQRRISAYVTLSMLTADGRLLG